MRKDDLDSLPIEERDIEIKRRSHRRLFSAFIIVDIALVAYIVYTIIMLATH